MNIAILRANALGDFIAVLPAIRALHKTYPKASITYLGLPWHIDFIKDRFRYISEVVAIPYIKGLRDSPHKKYDEKEIKSFVSNMQKKKFTLAFQMHGGGEFSNPFLKQLGAIKTVGLQAEGAETLDIIYPYVFYQNEFVRYLSVVGLVGVKPFSFVPKVPVLKKDVHEANDLLKNVERPYIVLHTGSTDPRRRWPPEYFAEVGDYLHKKKGYHIVLTGVQEEAKAVEEVQNMMKEKSTSLCGQGSLSSLVGILNQASLLISNDTGPLHLGRAVGIPTIGIYWGPNAVHWGPLEVRNHRIALSWMLNCPACETPYFKHLPNDSKPRYKCCKLTSYVSAVQPSEIKNYAEELLHTSYEDVTSL